MKPINCPECGFLIQDNSTFCKMCGCRIDKKSETADEDYDPQVQQFSGSDVQNTRQSGFNAQAELSDDDNETMIASAPIHPSPNPQSRQPSAPVSPNPSPNPSPNVQTFPVNVAAQHLPGQYPANGTAAQFNAGNPAGNPVATPGSNTSGNTSTFPTNYQGQYQGQYPGQYRVQYPGQYQGQNQAQTQGQYQGKNSMPFPGGYPGQYAPVGNSTSYNAKQKKTAPSGKKLGIILASVIGGILLIVGISVSVAHFTGPDRKYNNACTALEDQRFDDAYDAFIALGTYKDSKEKATETLYKKAIYQYKRENYKEASQIFSALGDYEDSPEQYKKAYYKYGLQFIGDGSYAKAIDVFTSLGDYEESPTMVFEAKYCYVVNHMDDSDEKTYEYLNELTAIKYKDSKDLYKTIYAWKATNFYFNTGGDATDVKESISRSSPLYCHFTIEGGPPDGTFYAYASALWPDGSKMSKQKSAVIMYRGGTYWWGWKDGIYNNPQNGKTGTFTLILYDENNNEIGRSSVKITK